MPFNNPVNEFAQAALENTETSIDSSVWDVQIRIDWFEIIIRATLFVSLSLFYNDKGVVIFQFFELTNVWIADFFAWLRMGKLPFFVRFSTSLGFLDKEFFAIFQFFKLTNVWIYDVDAYDFLTWLQTFLSPSFLYSFGFRYCVWIKKIDKCLNNRIPDRCV